jgi:Family of unknown function (DUF6447)
LAWGAGENLTSPAAHKAVGFFNSGIQMAIINIDGKDYEIDTLSTDAKAQLQSIQFVDAELQRVQAQISVLQTARVAYSKALQQALAQPPALFSGDTIKLG